MLDWWQSLTELERVLAYIAIPSTLLLVIQTIMLLIGLHSDSSAEFHTDVSGLGDGDTDADIDIDDADVDDFDDDIAHDHGLRVFTVRGFIAFFSIFGWSGLALLRGGTLWMPSILTAFLLGCASMALVAWTLKMFLKLQSDGSLDLRNAIGVSGSVYLTIPEKRTGYGKATLMVQGRLGEFDAVTDFETPIPTGREITVVSISNQNTVVVIPKKDEKEL